MFGIHFMKLEHTSCKIVATKAEPSISSGQIKRQLGHQGSRLFDFETSLPYNIVIIMKFWAPNLYSEKWYWESTKIKEFEKFPFHLKEIYYTSVM